MPNFLAIDADARGLFVAAASVKNGVVRVEKAAARTDAPPFGPATAAALGAAVRELLAAAGIKPAPVLLSVGRDRVLLKDVRHPPTPPADEPAVVRFQAQKDLTEPPDEVVMDYTPVPSAGAERRAAVVFARKEVVAAARAVCDAAGLKLAAVTPRPFVASAFLSHAAHASPDAAVGLLTLWPDGGELTVVRGNVVLFSRAIPAVAAGGEKPLVVELKRNLAVFATQHAGTPISALVLPEATGLGWSGRLADALPVPVVAVDPLAGTEADAVPDAARGRFAGPVGLLTAKAADALPVNLVAPRQPRAAANPNRARGLLAALVGVVVLGGGAVLGMLELEKAGRRVVTATYERDEADRKLQALELDAKRLAAADEFRAREVVWLDELYDLADRLPDPKRARVTEFEGVAIAPPKPAARPGMTAAKPATPAKAYPAGQLRLVVATEDPALVDRLVDGTNRDGYYAGTLKTTGGLAATGSRLQQFTVTTQVLHRGPADYRRRLPAPPKIVPPPPAAPAGPAGGIDGGFGGFDDFDFGGAP